MLRVAIFLSVLHCLLAGEGNFCYDEKGDVRCLYPCDNINNGSSYGLTFDCASVNPNWTCNGAYGYQCKWDTSCAAQGKVCSNGGRSADQECPGQNLTTGDGGQFCGCTFQANAFHHPPLDPNSPLVLNSPWLLNHCMDASCEGCYPPVTRVRKDLPAKCYLPPCITENGLEQTK
jgi:hypothetical protein